MDRPTLALKLKKQLLAGLADKLINSMKQSSIERIDEVIAIAIVSSYMIIALFWM